MKQISKEVNDLMLPNRV